MLIAVIVVYLLILFVVVYKSSSKMEGTLKSYVISNRSLGYVLLSFTIAATYINASAFIGGPGLVYGFGLSWILIASVQIPIVIILLGVIGKSLSKFAAKHDCITLGDFFEKRYNSKLLTFSLTLVIIGTAFIGLSVGLSGAAKILVGVTGISYQWNLLLMLVTLGIYTSIGGFKAVVATDVFQGVVMLISTALLLIYILVATGGVGNAVDTIKSIDGSLLSSTGDGKFPAGFILSFWLLVGFGMIGTPAMAVRCMAFRDNLSLKRAIVLGTILTGVLMLGINLAGFFARAVTSVNVIGFDSAISDIAIGVLPSILGAIFISGILSAILSTSDSVLILISGMVVKNIILRDTGEKQENKTLSDKKAFRVAKFVNIAILLIAAVIAFNPPEYIVYLSLFGLGIAESTFLWIILMGLFYDKANKYGAGFSGIFGFVSYISLKLFSSEVLATQTIFGLLPIVYSTIIALVAFLVFNKIGEHYFIKEKSVEI